MVTSAIIQHGVTSVMSNDTSSSSSNRVTEKAQPNEIESTEESTEETVAIEGAEGY